MWSILRPRFTLDFDETYAPPSFGDRRLAYLVRYGSKSDDVQRSVGEYGDFKENALRNTKPIKTGKSVRDVFSERRIPKISRAAAF